MTSQYPPAWIEMKRRLEREAFEKSRRRGRRDDEDDDDEGGALVPARPPGGGRPPLVGALAAPVE